MRFLFGLLSILHRRGVHAAVLAGLLVMPAVTAVGFLTDHGSVAEAARLDLGPLRGSLTDTDGRAPGRS